MIDYDEVFRSIGSHTVDNESVPRGTLAMGLHENNNAIVIRSPFDTEIVLNSFGIDKVTELVQEAEGLVVETDDTAKIGLSVALSARQLRKEISKARLSITKPYTAFCKEAISLEKQYTTQLQDCEDSLLCQVSEYTEKRKLTLEQNGIIDDSAHAISVPEGSFSEKRYHEFTITDFEKIPREYLALNNKAIQQAVDSGVRNIPGIKIEEIVKKHYRIRSKK